MTETFSRQYRFKARPSMTLLGLAAFVFTGCQSTEPAGGAGDAQAGESSVGSDAPPADGGRFVPGRPAGAYLALGRANLNSGNAELAVVNLEEYVKLRPTDPEGRYDLGRAYLAAGRASSARESMAIAYESEVDNETYIVGLADAIAATGNKARTYEHLRGVATRRNTVGDYLRIADYAERFGDPDEVEEALLTAAALDQGQTASIQLRLSDFYGRVGNSRLQIRRLRMAHFLDSDSQEVRDRAEALGEIVGPSWKLRPLERPAPRTGG